MTISKTAVLVLYSILACTVRVTIAEAHQRDRDSIAHIGARIRPESASDSTAPNAPQKLEDPGMLESSPVLSDQAEQVRQIAVRNGDKDFLMIDKARGEVILFENGTPTFSAAALTGASMGDRIPPNVLTFSFSHHLSPEQKVTPAGRFTVKPESDPAYGRVWTIVEVHGKDWDIAIHQVYLGTPSEHRDARIHSPNPDDRHITFGCINVENATVRLFTRKLPGEGRIPLYILPSDVDATTSFFPLRDDPGHKLSRN